jgi:hypothetical protein
VFSRPPPHEDIPAWIAGILAAAGINGDHNALRPDPITGRINKLGITDRRRVNADLVGSGPQQFFDGF